MKHFINSNPFLFLMIAFFFFSLTAILIQLVAFVPVAKYFSYDISVSYNATGLCKSHIEETFIERLYKQYAYEIDNNLEFSNKSQLLKFEKKQNLELLLIDGIAPLICIVLGILGFVYLLKKRNSYNVTDFSFKQWIAVFLSLFWLRWLLLLVVYIIFIGFNKKDTSLIINETNIAYTFNISPLFILVPLGLAGALICCITIFIFLPKAYRSMFLVAGITGSIVTLLLWFKLVGTLLLPHE